MNTRNVKTYKGHLIIDECGLFNITDFAKSKSFGYATTYNLAQSIVDELTQNTKIIEDAFFKMWECESWKSKTENSPMLGMSINCNWQSKLMTKRLNNSNVKRVHMKHC